MPASARTKARPTSRPSASSREAQGTGIGSMLLTALLEDAVARGEETVTLEVRADNPNAQRGVRAVRLPADRPQAQLLPTVRGRCHRDAVVRRSRASRRTAPPGATRDRAARARHRDLLRRDRRRPRARPRAARRPGRLQRRGARAVRRRRPRGRQPGAPRGDGADGRPGARAGRRRPSARSTRSPSPQGPGSPARCWSASPRPRPTRSPSASRCTGSTTSRPTSRSTSSSTARCPRPASRCSSPAATPRCSRCPT